MFVSDYNRIAVQFIDNFDYDKAPTVTIIIGKEGLGKTTLLDYFSQKIRNDITNSILIDSLKYASKYSFASYSGELSSFRKLFRTSKLFLLDNINLLKGKDRTISELFHTLDTILAQGGKTVITYGGDDFNLDFLGDRFASRLKSGFVIRLNEPTSKEIENFIEYYLSIIDQKKTQDFFSLPSERNMKKIVDFCDQLLVQPSKVENDLQKYMNKSIETKANIIVSLVSNYFAIEEKELLGMSKKPSHVCARNMIYILLNEIFDCSYRDISNNFKKDMSYIKNRSRKVKEENIELFETLCKKLYNQLNSNF